MIIVGAGISGLIAAHAMRSSQVLESGEMQGGSHKALLRFRDTSVSHLTGIPFKKVRVHKGIWVVSEGYAQPNIQLANLYAAKCLGDLSGGNRSIWNLSPVDRYIAPEDFYLRMLDNLPGRVSFGTGYDFAGHDRNHPVVSTAPLDVVTKALGIPTAGVQFKREGISVRRFRIPSCDLYQTIYFPCEVLNLYRASLSGDILILESAGEIDEIDLRQVRLAFGVPAELWDAKEDLGVVEQRYGKISPIEEGKRRRLVADLTQKHGIYSLGRFATWRNILLDDVANDITTIQRLINSSEYERKLAGA